MRGPVAVQSGNEGSVHRKLYATKKREAVNHNFQPSGVSDWGSQIQVTHEHVGAHSATCFSTHSPLHNHVFPEPQPAHNLHHGGHKNQVDGHIGSCEQKGAEEAADNEGEAHETIVARIWWRSWMALQKMLHLTHNQSLNSGKRTRSLWWCSTLEATSCCQPNL